MDKKILVPGGEPTIDMSQNYNEDQAFAIEHGTGDGVHSTRPINLNQQKLKENLIEIIENLKDFSIKAMNQHGIETSDKIKLIADETSKICNSLADRLDALESRIASVDGVLYSAAYLICLGEKSSPETYKEHGEALINYLLDQPTFDALPLMHKKKKLL